jgi:hypothetical protein
MTVGVTETIVAATPPTVTLVAPLRFVPLIKNNVPPVCGPVFGVTEEIVGASTGQTPQLESNSPRSAPFTWPSPLRSPGHACAQAFDERNAVNTPNEMAAVVANDVMERSGFMERLLYQL